MRDQPGIKHITLIGYRCSGKTSVGRELAKERKLPFYDTDVMIIDRLGTSIKEWVEEKGWESFRQVEKAVIKDISSLAPGVIALGGGAVMAPENREILKKNGRIVWLIADVRAISERMKADVFNKDWRPPLSEGDWETEIRETLAARYPFYETLADYQVDTTGKAIKTIVDEIRGMMRIQGVELKA
jgi:shikimate kinase